MKYEVIALGGSLGGARAVAEILAGLAGDFRVPVVATLHRLADPGQTLLHKLEARSSLPVSEAADKDRLTPGHVYIAPPDYHLLIEQGYLALSTEGPVSLARPSIDVLFESAADAWGEQAIGVILSGASSDGVAGLARIKECGGLTIVQHPETAESRIMPEAAIRASRADLVLPLEQIAAYLMRLCVP